MTHADGNLHPRSLITGGTGTLGYALTKAFLAEGFSVAILSRDPHKQTLFHQQFPQVELFLGDIRDAEVVARAVKGRDIVVHAAALKQVDVGQVQSLEFKSVNIDGALNVARQCQLAGVRKNLFISSDKCAAPVNLYGYTKAIAEYLWNSHNTATTLFSAVRYGNVMGSNGSVIPIWRQQVARGLPIMVRTPDTTRFFMLKSQAVDLVQQALREMQGGETFIPGDIPAFSLHDLAEQFEPDYSKWLLLPLSAGEKVHEVLVAPGECVEAVLPKLYRIVHNKAGKFEVADEFKSQTARRIAAQELLVQLEK